MKTFEIKITGSGDKRDLIMALKSLADSIKESDIETTGSRDFEDPILMAVVTEIEK